MRSAPPRSPPTPWCANAWSAGEGYDRKRRARRHRGGRRAAAADVALHALDLGRCRLSPRRGELRAITSLQNERVKLIRSLEMRKVRRETGLFVAEGASVLVTARDAGWVPKILVFLAGSAQTGVASRAARRGRRPPARSAWRSPRRCSAKLAAKDNPQTMLAVLRAALGQ